MMINTKIRIRLRGYDHKLLDKSALDIVDTAKKTGAKICGAETERSPARASSAIAAARATVAEPQREGAAPG